MSYKLKCPGCNAVQSVGQLKLQGDGTVRCGRCAYQRAITDWMNHSHPLNAAPTPNALPRGTYVVWGTKTKEAFGPGVLRGFMEKQADMRPGAAAKPAGADYAQLTAGTTAARIYIVKDDVLLKGEYYAPPANVAGAATGLCALLLNGSGASIGHYMQSVIAGYQALGAAVLAMDYRGIGESEGRSTAHGLYTDAEVMLDYLTGAAADNGLGWRPSRVVVHGFSIGSAPATDLARKRSGAGAGRIGGLVLHCPIASFASTAAYKQGQAGAGQTMQRVASKVASWGVGFNNVGKLLHIDLPVHVVYAVNDSYVNPQDARDLAAVQRGVNTTTQGYQFGDHTDCQHIFNNACNVAAHTTLTLDAFLTGLPRN